MPPLKITLYTSSIERFRGYLEMKILEVYLEGYKRLKVNKVNSIRLVASELIQLIVGTNGSGKSSLQEQVNCWPADRKDFKVGGKKVVKMEHNNSIYETRQYFNKKNSSFEFIVDGVNLNEGETGSVQRELIKIHFGLDAELVDLFLGKVRFTRMNPTQRREILTKISGLDLTYAIGLFKRVASAGRDVTGAKKVLDKRMVNEVANVWKEEDWEQWQGMQSRLSDVLTKLMTFSNPKASNYSEVDSRYRAQVDKMNSIADRYMDEYMALEPLAIAERNIYSVNDYRDQLAEINGNKSGLEANKQGIMEDLDALQKELADLQTHEAIDAVEWNRIKADCENELEKLKATKLRFSWLHHDITFQHVLGEVMSLMSEFLDGKTNWDFKGNVDRATYEKETAELKQHREALARADNVMTRIRNRIQDIKEAKNEECPKCKHVYIPGVSENDLVQLEEKLVKGVEFHEKTVSVIADLERSVEQFEKCQENMRGFNDITRGFMMFRGVWGEVQEDEVLFNNPHNVLLYLNEAKNDIDILDRIFRCEEKLLIAEKKLIKAGEHTNVTGRLESIAKRETVLTEKLNSTIDALGELDKTRAYLQTNFKRAEFVTNSVERIEAIVRTYNELYEERLEAMQELRLQEDIALHQQKLATVTKVIQEQDTQRSILKDLEEQAKILEEEVELWKLLTSELSPTTGLIADQLLGFMHKFTESMNGIIEKIWSHELRILPCKGSGENLDYKFPLIVDGDSEPTPDIAVASTGQLDIIDFAFVLVAMAYLDMEDYPLYADELGSSFDEEHRESLQRFLKMLIDSSSCSQLWLISHAYAVQNSLGACETCVIDKSNITVPMRYNEHVEFA